MSGDIPRKEFCRTISSETLANAIAALRLLEEGKMDSYKGKYVAVLGGQIIGAHDDDITLRNAVAEKYQVPLGHVGIEYVPEEDWQSGVLDIDIATER